MKPTIHKDPMEAISKENTPYLQKPEKEARSRVAYTSVLPASPHWGRSFDEDRGKDKTLREAAVRQVAMAGLPQTGLLMWTLPQPAPPCGGATANFRGGSDPSLPGTG